MPRRTAAVLSLLLVVTTLGAAPAEEFIDHRGEAHDLFAEGQWTVVDFAANWCAPCHRSLPVLQAWAKDHPEVRVLVISVDRREAQRDELIADVGLELPVLWDRDFRLAEHFQPQGMPATFVLDGGGEVIYRETGFSEKKWKQLAAFLENHPRPSKTADGRESRDSDGARVSG